MNEKHFISRLKKQDQSAFRELVENFGKQVFNTSLGILQNTEDAEDISQEVFIEVFHSIDLFKGEARLSTWIYRITVTKSLEFLRKKNRKKRFAFVLNVFGDENAIHEKEISHFNHPGVQLENKERAAILFKAIERLPENQKSAFILHRLEGLSYVDVAEVMKISLSSVESLMFRAKQNLQKWLASYYEENEK